MYQIYYCKCWFFAVHKRQCFEINKQASYFVTGVNAFFLELSFVFSLGRCQSWFLNILSYWFWTPLAFSKQVQSRLQDWCLHMEYFSATQVFMTFQFDQNLMCFLKGPSQTIKHCLPNNWNLHVKQIVWRFSRSQNIVHQTFYAYVRNIFTNNNQRILLAK